MEKTDIVLLDGAIGTCLWAKSTDKVAVWRYNTDAPDIVRELHNEYIAAGSQMILSNTFGANRIAVSPTGYSLSRAVASGVRIARECARGNVKVALSVGPLPTLIEPYGDLCADDAYEMFDEQISSGVTEHPDVILLETFMDVEMMKIAVRAAMKHDLPVFCSLSFLAVGKTIMGQSVKDFVDGMRGLSVQAIGLNCSLGPDTAVPVIREFRNYTDLPLIFKPNAGKPALVQGETVMQFDADTFVEDCMPALGAGVRYIGGCCGSDPGYISALKKRIFS